MGSSNDCNSNTLYLPDTRNLCNVLPGSYNNSDNGMPYFCTSSDQYRTSYCGAMSNTGEWIWDHTKPKNKKCHFDKCNYAMEVPSNKCCDRNGSSKKCCGSNGTHTRCKRVAYTGDPLICCLNDYTCATINSPSNDNNYQPTCFSDPDPNGPPIPIPFTNENDAQVSNAGHKYQNRTCDPKYRSPTSTNCKEVIQQYCTGTLPSDDPNSTEWLDRWNINSVIPQRSCPYALARNIYSFGTKGNCPPQDLTLNLNSNNGCNVPPLYPIDSNGYFWAQQVVTAAMEKYTTQGFKIGAIPGNPGYNPFQDTLYNNVCCPIPGLCQDGLTEICGQYNTAQVSVDPMIAQWCGCHLTQSQYQDYSVKFNIPPECTPMCNRVGTIPIVGINALPVKCEQQICLIDGVTVNLVNAQIQGGLNFNQICGNCPSGAQCSCLISNNDLEIYNAMISGNVTPVESNCGSLMCTQTNPGPTGPEMINVPCGTGINPYLEYQLSIITAQEKARKTSIFWTLVIVGVCIILVFFIIFIIHPDLYPVPGTYLIPPTKQKPSNFSPTEQKFTTIDEEFPLTASTSPSSSGVHSIEETPTDANFTPMTTFTSIE